MAFHVLLRDAIHLSSSVHTSVGPADETQRTCPCPSRSSPCQQCCRYPTCRKLAQHIVIAQPETQPGAPYAREYPLVPLTSGRPCDIGRYIAATSVYVSQGAIR